MSEDVSDAVLAMAEISVDEAPAEETPAETPTEEVAETEESTEAEAPAEEEVETTEEDKKGIDPQYAAMLAKADDEKNKRQQMERKYEELQAKFDAANAKPPPDPVEDPDGFQQWQKDALSQADEARASERVRDRIDMSRMLVSTLKDDYEEVEAIFLEEAKNHPVLAQQMTEADNPALFAYEQGQKIQMLKTDPDEMREQIRQEERERLKAEFESDAKAKAEKQAEIDNAISPSLAKEGNSGLETEESAGMDFIREATGQDANKRR